MSIQRELTIGLVMLLVLACPVAGQIISGESVVHDPVRNRYLAGDQANGNIWAVDYEGNKTLFADVPVAAKGLMVRHDTLFCCASISGLVLLDLNDGHTLLQYDFPTMNDLNDVIGDTSGNIYASDAQGNQVHRLRLSDLSSQLVLSGFAWANGMVFDTANNRILICQWIEKSPITAINLSDHSTTEVGQDSLPRLDGLAWDAYGNLLVSSQSTGDIFVYEPSLSSPPKRVLDLVPGSADIAYNYLDTILAIPNTNNGQLRFERMRDPDRDLFFEGNDNCPHVPNPEQADQDHDGVGDACCCIGVPGNVNNVGIVDIADLSALVSHLTGGGYVLPCPQAANVSGTGIVDLADLSALVSYLTGGGFVLPVGFCVSDTGTMSIEQELQSALDRTLGDYDVKGASATVIMPGRSSWSGVSGISHDGAPITPDMMFCLGSVTKTYTATLILGLMEEERFAVDDSLKKWLPDFQNIDRNITIRQLLNHTSGIFNYSMHPDFDPRLQADFNKLWTPEEVLTSFVAEPYCAPGGGYNYSNTNYILLGMIIKGVTGTAVSNELRTRLLSPLDLDLTFLPVEETTTGTIAHPWLDIDDDGIMEDCSAVPTTAAYSIGWTAGALHSTAEDLARFSNALLYDKTVLSQSTLDQMLDFYPVDTNLGYGFGIAITQDFLEGVQGIGSDGHSYGYGARLVFVPAVGVSIAVLVNDDNGYDCKAAISRALARVVLDHLGDK